MIDRNQEIEDYHMTELKKCHAAIDKKYRRKNRLITIVGSILMILWTYFCFFYW